MPKIKSYSVNLAEGEKKSIRTHVDARRNARFVTSQRDQNRKETPSYEQNRYLRKGIFAKCVFQWKGASAKRNPLEPMNHITQKDYKIGVEDACFHIQQLQKVRQRDLCQGGDESDNN